jgi:cobaltochelatase CobS
MAAAKPKNTTPTPTIPVADAFGVKAPATVVIRRHRDGDPFAEKPDEGYVFSKEMVKLAQFWLIGNPQRGLMLTGPTGTGKTAFVREVAARTRWPLVTVGCHGELEFTDLLGHLSLSKDGGTEWVDGPLIRAMKAGAILLLDEVNFLRPAAVGGLNGVLDSGSFEVPQTGEVVTVHPDFRLAATANSITGDDAVAYRGTQRQNVAFLDRFIGAEVPHLEAADEIKALMGRVTHLQENVATLLVNFANGVRAMNREGRVLETISFRALHAWGEMIARHNPDDEKGQAEAAIACLKTAVLFRCGRDSATVIETAFREAGQRQFPSVF